MCVLRGGIILGLKGLKANNVSGRGPQAGRLKRSGHCGIVPLAEASPTTRGLCGSGEVVNGVGYA
jgi:hypothetical protein